MSEINYGDEVIYSIHGHREVMFCIGHMAYSSSVPLLATEDAWGMPINEKWCDVVSTGNDVVALRQRYADKFGSDRMLPLSPLPPPPEPAKVEVEEK